MHEIVDKMLSRPIATIFVTSCFFNGVAKLIGAARGVNTAPTVNVTVPTKKSEENT